MDSDLPKIRNAIDKIFFGSKKHRFTVSDSFHSVWPERNGKTVVIDVQETNATKGLLENDGLNKIRLALGRINAGRFSGKHEALADTTDRAGAHSNAEPPRKSNVSKIQGVQVLPMIAMPNIPGSEKATGI